MKPYITAMAVCGCLLIGSLYPKLLLEHHVKLVNREGRGISVEGEYLDEIPLKMEFRFLSLFR